MLIIQIQALQRELNRAETVLTAEQVDSSLRDRVLARFAKLIKKQQQALRNVREDINQAQPLDLCWTTFRDIRRESVPLFRECLAFLEGALARAASLDNGLCRIADALLDDLSHHADVPWDRFTILAEGEFFAEMAEIIRLRFPEVSLWSLPVAAHEFGHFLGPQLEVRDAGGRSRHPFQDLLDRQRRREPQHWHFLHEYFSDVFATYALGPAYAQTCILLRFDPGTAHIDAETHPSSAKRAYLILAMLAKMVEEGGGAVLSYRGRIGSLGDLWRESLQGAGQPRDLLETDRVELDGLLDELSPLLESEVPGVRYDGWLRALGLSGEIRPKESKPKLGENDSLRDVLNAAWQCRLEYGSEDTYSVHQVEERALALCREVQRRKPRR